MDRNNLFTLLFVVLLGAIGYTWYHYWRSPEGDAIPQEEFTRSIAKLERLRTIDIDTTIFQDPVFMSLEAPPDYVEPEVTPGRVNPFLNFK